jgi:GNAT superfamily N-acetyltransferase
MQSPEIILCLDPSEADFEAITGPLIEHNQLHGPPTNFHKVALMLRSPEGTQSGGLWGRIAYDWLFVEYLSLPPALQRTGLGSALMAQAEDIARQHNCVGVWLDTFAFQSLPFYLKLGYQQFGQIDDHPRGYPRYFLQKRLS